jgi:hypothetical protein
MIRLVGIAAKYSCGSDAPPVIGNNTVYSPTANVTECGVSLKEWQAQGFDLGTTASVYPDDSVLLTLARQLLGMPPAA